MKIQLIKGVKPFLYPKLGKVWQIKDNANIPKEIFDKLKSKVVEKKKKEEKVVKNG